MSTDNTKTDTMTDIISDQATDIVHAGCLLTVACFSVAAYSGWHNNIKTGLPYTPEEQAALFPTRIALMHSELSEALEGHRKNAMDDKLPHRKAAEVELADAVIRIFDCAGGMGLDVAGAIAEKLVYNATRADHKPENRLKADGKKF